MIQTEYKHLDRILFKHYNRTWNTVTAYLLKLTHCCEEERIRKDKFLHILSSWHLNNALPYNFQVLFFFLKKEIMSYLVASFDGQGEK